MFSDKTNDSEFSICPCDYLMSMLNGKVVVRYRFRVYKQFGWLYNCDWMVMHRYLTHYNRTVEGFPTNPLYLDEKSLALLKNSMFSDAVFHRSDLSVCWSKQGV